MKTTLIHILGLLFCVQLSAQNCRALLNQANNNYLRGDYEEALKFLVDLDFCDDEDKYRRDRQNLQEKIFDKVDTLRIQAEDDRRSAYEARRRTLIAKEEAEQPQHYTVKSTRRRDFC